MAMLPAHSPLSPLVQEHATGLRLLTALDKAAMALGSKNLSSEVLTALADFQGFLDRVLPGHFKREETYLFPRLEAALGAEGSPSAVLRKEHADLLAMARDWRHLVDGIQTAYADTAPELQRLSRRIIAVLGQHFRKEDEVLFPLCHKVLSPEDLETVGMRIAGHEANEAPGFTLPAVSGEQVQLSDYRDQKHNGAGTPPSGGF